jgi:hypothetical protein
VLALEETAALGAYRQVLEPLAPPWPSLPTTVKERQAVNDTQGNQEHKEQTPWGAVVVLAGIAAIVGIFAIAVTTYGKASDVATAVASVSGVIAALVGAYFGIRGSSLAQGKAMEMVSTEAKQAAEASKETSEASKKTSEAAKTVAEAAKAAVEGPSGV